MTASDRSSVDTVTPWGDSWGYSRAVRIGDRIEISGTAAWRGQGEVHAPDDPYEQARYALAIMVAALQELGGSVEHVVSTRAYLRDVEDFKEVGRAHSAVFGEIKPASTCVGGIALLHPDLRVEFEASAIVPTSA